MQQLKHIIFQNLLNEPRIHVHKLTKFTSVLQHVIYTYDFMAECAWLGGKIISDYWERIQFQMAET